VAVDRYSVPPVRSRIDTIEIKKDVDQAYLLMISIGPKSDSPDQYALDLLATALGDGESSRLWKKLRDEEGLVYSVGFSFYAAKYEGTLSANATLDPVNLPKVEKLVNTVLDEAKKNGFTEAELRKAKNKIKTNHYASLERGLDLADKYAQYDSFVGYKFVESYPTNIENVTLAELNAVAHKYLNTDSYVLATVVPK
jgi:zinc protease